VYVCIFVCMCVSVHVQCQWCTSICILSYITTWPNWMGQMGQDPWMGQMGQDPDNPVSAKQWPKCVITHTNMSWHIRTRCQIRKHAHTHTQHTHFQRAALQHSCAKTNVSTKETYMNQKRPIWINIVVALSPRVCDILNDTLPLHARLLSLSHTHTTPTFSTSSSATSV